MSIVRVGVQGAAIPDGSVTDVKVASGAAINADKLADGTANHVFTVADDTKLTGIAAGATANSSDATLLNRVNHTGSQLSTTISDFVEAVQDTAAGMITSATHTGVSWTYNDAGGTLAATVTGGGGGSGGGFTVYNAKTDYAATGDGSTNDTTAIQNAINAAFTAGGGIVYLPPGTYSITQLSIKNRVWLQGAGLKATLLRHRSGSTGAIVQNYKATGSEANGQNIAIRHLAIDGSTGGTPNIGIYLEQSTSPTAGDDWTDSRWLVEHVVIYGVNGNGFEVQATRNEGRAINVHVFDVEGHGFEVSGSDCFFISCNAGASGLAGFHTDGTSNRFVNCKSWFSGAITAASGHGFHLYGTSPGGAAFSNCEAQDNKAAGWRIDTSSHRTILDGCVADSNSARGAGLNAALEIDASRNCIVSLIAYERQGASSTQTSAVKLTNSATANRIRVSHSAASGGSSVGNAIDSGSTSLQGNVIEVNAQDGSQAPSFAASFTPDPYAGSTILVTGQNANTTVNNTTNKHPGCRMTLIFVKAADANSYTFTWGTQYKTNVTATGTTSAVRTVIQFVYDGTNWQQTGSYSAA
jgi:hypothetical protein